MDHVSVKYIGKRAQYVDGAFGTRILFNQGESRLVPADKARLMLKHPDVYVLGVADAPIAVVPATKTEADDTQDLRDAVSAMSDKDSLSDFAQMKYGIKLDKRKSIDDLRFQAIGLIDQYGAN
jgi:hypothetical protein